MVPRVAGSIPVNRPSLIKKEVIEFLQKTKHIQALSIHISFKKRSARNQFSKLLHSDDKES